MNYRDMLGFPKKKVKKVVTPIPTAPPVTELLKKEFGPLNEWGKVDPGPKRWSSAYTSKDGLTEFERKGGKDLEEEGKITEQWTKVPFDKIKVGTKITYQMKVVYIVTKLYPGGFLMKIYKSGNNPGMFAPKARIEQDNYESQVKMGFIKGVK